MKNLTIVALCALGCLLLGSMVFSQVRPRPPVSPVRPPVVGEASGPAEVASDKPGQTDTVKEGQPVQVKSDFPATALGKLLDEHLNLMVNVGRDAEQKYQTSLRQLRPQAAEAVPLLFRAYQQTAADDYFRRWQMVETMRELQSEAALKPLVTIATTPLPPERWSDPERFSVDKEANIRVTAVEGLAALAKSGNKTAEATLVRLLDHRDLTIRRSAVRGYLAAGRDQAERAGFLREKLPASDHGLITLATTNVRRVPHPDDVPTTLAPPKRENDDEAPKVAPQR